MNRRAAVVETPVLIVGGGPIGLALAAELGRGGAKALLVEKNENRLGQAKMLEVSVRTMEFCRQLGIADKVRNWGFPLDWPLDSAFVTDLQGYELGRVRTPPLGAGASSEFSPERGRPCPGERLPAKMRPIVQPLNRGSHTGSFHQRPVGDSKPGLAPTIRGLEMCTPDPSEASVSPSIACHPSRDRCGARGWCRSLPRP
jgi:FAD binding domain